MTRWNSRLKASAPAKRKVAVKKLHKKRAAKRKCEQWGPPGYRDFIVAFGCECRRARLQNPLICFGDIMAHHVKTRGARGKGMDNLVPLCAQHHWTLHNYGRQSFVSLFGLDLKEKAELYGTVWRLSTES